MNRTVFSCVRWVLLLAPAFQPGSRADLATDGSFGAAGALPGPNFAIPANLGKKVGGNLFHSFSEFSLDQTQSATFSGPADVANIFSRVTGGTKSTIDGALTSTISGANFFLLNPQGVIFGPNATVDVSGSFAVVAGERIALSDGTRFRATPGPSDAVLSSAPPAAFGFLSGTSGPITIEGSQLSAAEGARWSLIGGKVKLKDAALDASSVVIRAGRFTMNNSRLGIAARNPGDKASVKVRESAALTNGSSITATALGEVGGTVVAQVSAPSLLLSGNSAISSLASAAERAGNLRIKAGQLVLTEVGRLDANTFGAGAGGSIDVMAHDILIRGLGSRISAAATDIGASGDVRLEISGRLTVRDGGGVQTSTSGAGAGGAVSIAARDVAVIGSAALFTAINADTEGAGDAGTVRLDLSGRLKIAAGAQVSSETFGTGRGGTVTVAAQSLRIDGRGSESFTAISTETQSPISGGRGGNIRLTIRGPVELVEGGQISARTLGPGAGGSVRLRADSAFISGAGAASFSGIDASTFNAQAGGPGGDVRLDLARGLMIVDGGRIAANTSGSGVGGSIHLNAHDIVVSGEGSAISAKSSRVLNGGPGGNVAIRADSISAWRDGEISVATEGSGASGSIDLAARHIMLDDARITADTRAPEEVALPVTVSNLEVMLDIDHPRDQDLVISLAGSDGTFVELFRGVGGDGANFDGTILADDAPTSIADGVAPFTGRFRPLLPLALFDGIEFNGFWFLVFEDPTRNSAATLNSWALTVGDLTITSFDVPKTLPNPDGSANRLSILPVSVPPAAIVPIVPGKGGDIRLAAERLDVFNKGRISARTFDSSPGGDVQLNVSDRARIADSGVITASTQRSGAGGSVRIRAADLAVESGGLVSAATSGSGAGGDVTLEAGRTLRLADSGLITASTRGSGIGGNLNVTARDVLISSRGTLSAATSGTGHGGDVNLNVSETLRLSSAGLITAGTAGIGNGGNIRVQAGTVSISGGEETAPSLIGAESASLGAGGRGGDISIEADHLEIDGETGMRVGVSATSLGTGSSGSVQLQLGTLSLDSNAFIGSSNTGDGNAGSVMIHATDEIDLRGASLITTSAAQADAGLIEVASDSRIDLRDGSSVTASAGRNGGSIRLTAPDFIYLRDSSLTATAGTATVAGSAQTEGGSGGNIFIDPEFIVLDHSLISANAAIGRGGNILLRADNFLFSESAITATGSTAGTVEIVAPQLDLSAALVILPGALVDASTQLRELCAHRLGLDFSSFLVIGRGGVSLSPDDPLPSRNATLDRDEERGELR